MTTVCPDCRGRRTTGANRCRTCSPSSAVGDQVVSAGRRLRNRLTGRTTEVQPDRVVTRQAGTESVGLTPEQKAKLKRQRTAATKKKRS